MAPTTEPIGIAMLGCGVVGSGVVRILGEQRELLRKRTGLTFDLRHVVIRDPARHREHAGILPLTTDAHAAIDDKRVKIVLELLGGTDPAFGLIERALRLGKPVVTANKSLLADKGTCLFSTALEAHRAVIDVTRGLDAAQEAFADTERGVPTIGFAELYFQTAYDPTVAPPGKHTMSAFVQYAPYDLAEGTWDERRTEIGQQILALIGRYCDIDDVVEHIEVLGPPDIEARIGLTGGHIFQGECMPDQMWWRRMSPRAPGGGVYLCGAATHPAGSVIGLNGRNCAEAVLSDLTP